MFFMNIPTKEINHALGYDDCIEIEIDFYLKSTPGQFAVKTNKETLTRIGDGLITCFHTGTNSFFGLIISLSNNTLETVN